MPNPKVALYVSVHFNGPRGNIVLKENPKGKSNISSSFVWANFISVNGKEANMCDKCSWLDISTVVDHKLVFEI